MRRPVRVMRRRITHPHADVRVSRARRQRVAQSVPPAHPQHVPRRVVRRARRLLLRRRLVNLFQPKRRRQAHQIIQLTVRQRPFPLARVKVFTQSSKYRPSLVRPRRRRRRVRSSVELVTRDGVSHVVIRRHRRRGRRRSRSHRARSTRSPNRPSDADSSLINHPFSLLVGPLERLENEPDPTV